ncbi:4-alpha-glucanotransferase [Pyrococcus furiosus DSM 3638]|uniref:Alpha-amylase n=3 Tax=Pyrococcus furiosus TaxID=2261 RepID=AMYA_PYRFU|nr:MULTISPECIES: alpha-amylase AmyA [Pyrococcus]P49067.2 RecName: Full=Alpha-amylase [Pyrococcus furiosus DSM 3638]AAA72035.1 alpha-amylase [Pyrococcus furiosus]AFN03059.1 alpha-amylase [Pyrococcus furiosus COM1]MDK2870220.1 4-alpha-glucanotransferase [Pyrococcus sp.]QEK77991.1 4-alpha-glucanotransferase [Pyrococcus furiosus DSM 3638]
MGDKINFIFGIHNHQPLGNFGWVFEEAYEKCYWPFLETLEEYPNMKVAIHTSGPLIEWLQDNRPEYIDLLRSLVKRGQVEIVVAGFYEPVLASIPKEDRIEQIRLMKEWAKSIGFDARGVWLTERVWQPELVKTLKESGIDYVIVDDYHFMSAGLSKEELYWPYYTEDGGEVIAVFPIDEKLRYLIPFRPVDKVLEYLHSLIDGDESKVAVFHDDGEKFGIWPGTYEWVYEKGWLREFFDRISSDEKINLMLYTEYLEKYKPRGLVYLPIASYFEMSEWSLPAKQARLFVEFVNELKVKGIFEKYRVFVRGGIWKNFFYKYPESNYMHKRMLMVSKLVRNNPEARKYLLRAQCNDAYWHGLFGGVYLPHLRRAIWNNLIKANSYVSLGKVIRDIDYDGFEEVLIENDNFYAVFKPSYGGSLVEFSSKNRLVNYVDVLARRWEHYHGYVESQFDGVASIHELEKKIPDEIRKEVAYDKYRRFMLQDHVVPLGTTLEDFMFSRQQEIGEFPRVPYSYELLDGGIRLKREHLGIEVEKTVKLVNDGFEVEYIVNNKTGNPVLFAVELNVAVQSIMESPGVLRGKEIVVDDKYAVGKFALKFEDEMEVWKYPVKTLSQSESGWDLIQQGVSYIVPIRLEDKIRFKLKFEEASG